MVCLIIIILIKNKTHNVTNMEMKGNNLTNQQTNTQTHTHQKMRKKIQKYLYFTDTWKELSSWEKA